MQDLEVGGGISAIMIACTCAMHTNVCYVNSLTLFLCPSLLLATKTTTYM